MTMIDLTLMSTLISPIIVLACLAIGYVIKNLIPNEDVNRFIPLIMLVLGIIFNVWYVGGITLEVAVAGAISGLASTGLYEAFSNFLIQKKVIDLGKIDMADRSDDTQDSYNEESQYDPIAVG